MVREGVWVVVMCDAWFVAVSSQPVGLERTQDMHNGSGARRSHVLAAGITPRAPLLCRPLGERARLRTHVPLLEAVRPRRGRPRGDRTGSVLAAQPLRIAIVVALVLVLVFVVGVVTVAPAAGLRGKLSV